MDFDFLSANLQIAYPFRDIIAVMRPSGVEDIQPLVAAIRVYTADRRAAELILDEIELQTSDGFTTFDVAKLELRWSDDDVPIVLEDGLGVTAKIAVYGSWVVVRWRHNTEDFVFHLVFPLAAAETDSSSSPSDSSDGPYLTYRFWKDTDDIKILSSLVKQGPGKVQRIYLKRGSTLTQLAGPGQELTIRPGFNMEIEDGAADTADAGRKLTRVAIDAVPGAGLGRYLICKGNEYLLTLNGAGPDDNGSLKLAPEECYWLDIPVATGPTSVSEPQHNIGKVATLEPNQVRLRNACGPCCSCDDYVAAYNNLRKIWDAAKAIPIDDLRDRYTALVQLLAIKQPSDDILFIAQSGNSKLIVQVSVWNNTKVPVVDDVVITLTFTLPDGVEFTVIQSVISGLGDPRFVQPEDKDTTPNTTVEIDLEAYQVYWWNLNVTLTDMELDLSLIHISEPTRPY